jgi:tight adherence protein C
VAVGLTPLARLATPTGEDELSALRRKLSHAGFRSPYALQLFLAVKVILSLLLLAGLFWLNAMRLHPVRMFAAWALLAAGLGFFAPNVWLAARARERKRQIDESLPDTLDLMVTCVEAGLGLDAALQRVAVEIALARPVLAEELTLTFLEIKAGARRTEAFRSLADRTGVQDLKTLAATLNQTDLFGTSVSTALRVQAEGMRIRRTQHAEERAGMLSVKMTFPLVLCFLPALLAVILGPAWVNIVEVLHHK